EKCFKIIAFAKREKDKIQRWQERRKKGRKARVDAIEVASDSEIDEGKNGLVYSVSHLRIKEPPFLTSGIFHGKPVKFLIDTGADISVAPASFEFPQDNERPNISIRSACGTIISASGQSINSILEIDNHKFEFAPLIIDSKLEYIIIGVDVIRQHPNILLNRLKFINTSQVNKLNVISDTGKIILKDFAEYKDIFRKEIDNTTTCNETEHLIEL
ncbi:putative LTR transposable element, partial [Pseudoloma neurophilia]